MRRGGGEHGRTVKLSGLTFDAHGVAVTAVSGHRVRLRLAQL